MDEARQQMARAPRTGLTKQAGRLVKLLAVAFVVHVFVVPQIGGARRALGVVGSVNPWLLGAVVGLEAAALLAYARLTHLLLPEETRPSLAVVLGSVVASTGVSHVVPGGAAATLAVNHRLLGRAGVSTETLGFALGLQALGSAVVLNVLLWLSLIVSVPASGFQPIYAAAACVGAVFMALVAGTTLAVSRGRSRFVHHIARTLGRLPWLDEGRVRVALENLADQLLVLVRDRTRLGTVVTLAVANWLLDAAALWVALSAFGHRPGIIGLVVAYGLANVMAAVPVSPGGLGIVEAVLIPTLVGFGTPRAEAAIGVVVYRLASFWLPIPAGAIAFSILERVQGRRISGFQDVINEQAARRAGTRVDGS